MARDIAIPKLGMTMKEAKVVAWMFNEGDRVEKGQVVMQVETAKVTHDVEAQASGFLHILVPPGETHPVGAAVGQLAETEEELAELQARDACPGRDRSGSGGASGRTFGARLRTGRRTARQGQDFSPGQEAGRGEQPGLHDRGGERTERPNRKGRHREGPGRRACSGCHTCGYGGRGVDAAK